MQKSYQDLVSGVFASGEALPDSISVILTQFKALNKIRNSTIEQPSKDGVIAYS
jgi:hypothetical protein